MTQLAPAYSAEKPKLKSKVSLVPSVPITTRILALHRLGWTNAAIARYITPYAGVHPAQGSLMVKCALERNDIKPMTFGELYCSTLPLDKLIEQEHYDELNLAALSLLNGPSKPLSTYDIHLIKILVLLGWKKKRIASLFDVSNTLVTLYSNNLTPWTFEEVQKLFPTMLPPDEEISTRVSIESSIKDNSNSNSNNN